MTPTLTDTQATLYALLAPLEATGAADAVYDHEPGREASGPCYVTVAFERTTPTEQVWAVRVYRQLADGLEDATAGFYATVDAVDDLLAGQTYGPSEWQAGVVDELSSLVARCFINVPRESF